MGGYGRICVLSGATGIAKYSTCDLAFENLFVLFAPIPVGDLPEMTGISQTTEEPDRLN